MKIHAIRLIGEAMFSSYGITVIIPPFIKCNFLQFYLIVYIFNWNLNTKAWNVELLF